MGSSTTRERFIEAIKKDNEAELILILKKDKPIVKPDEYINESFNFTALNIAASFGSIKAVVLLLKNGWNVDVAERKNLNSPLLLACKFGYLDIAKLLVDNKANVDYMNKSKLTCLDMAIISGHYAIAHYLLSKNMKMNTLDYYKALIAVPSFEMDLFYKTLSSGVSPEEAPSFALKKLSSKASKKNKGEDKDKDSPNVKVKEIEEYRVKDSNDIEKPKEIEESIESRNNDKGPIECPEDPNDNKTGLVLLSESKVLKDSSINIKMKNSPNDKDK